MLTTTQWIVLALLAVAAVVIPLIVVRSGRRRHAILKDRFGPEYDRTVEQHGNVARAEKELAAREKRIHQQKVRPLPETDRARFSAEWNAVQARFVDDPSGAVQAADDLIKAVMLACGYASERFEQRVADLSVEHANVVEDYRSARELANANREGTADTEQLRQAFVHYRALFADLLEQPRLPDQQQLQEARA